PTALASTAQAAAGDPLQQVEDLVGTVTGALAPKDAPPAQPGPAPAPPSPARPGPAKADAPPPPSAEASLAEEMTRLGDEEQQAAPGAAEPAAVLPRSKDMRRPARTSSTTAPRPGPPAGPRAAAGSAVAAPSPLATSERASTPPPTAAVE